jgi:hypothetical protein
MDFSGIFKILIASVIGLFVSAFASMSTDLAGTKTRLQLLEKNIEKIATRVEQIHWYLTKNNNAKN